MEDSISRKLRLAHEKYVKGFLEANPQKMAELAGGTYENGTIYLPHFNETLAVDCETAKVEPKPATMLEEILVLKYLQEAQGMEGPGKDYLAFIQLPFGSHHIKAFKIEVTDALAKTFGDDFDKFASIAESLGGTRANDGDISYILPFFPKIYVKIILWEADEEFPAACNFLFDNKCSFHMDTDGLNELANATAELFVEEAQK
ncbi:MAG: DUF3786 domain-containing protein [Firmicutes bacterium]|nr:DUF3786 domain-containing protein [Bacillota bacterium]